VAIKNPLIVYEGRMMVQCGKVGKSGSEEGYERRSPGKSPSKEHWLEGLGLDVSPIKTRSTRRKNADSKGELEKLNNNTYEQRALRGLKALARAKS
jgi:hypothetical protein